MKEPKEEQAVPSELAKSYITRLKDIRMSNNGDNDARACDFMADH